MKPARDTLALGLVSALGLPVSAAELALSLELPRLPVAEYHRPYVALWVETAHDQKPVGSLAVWYDLKKRDQGGTKWLKDLRQWWRKGGQSLAMPADGISGATRAPGTHAVPLSATPLLQSLPAGDYQLVVEAARENGGRELQRLPFSWPVRAAAASRAQGEHELGALALEARP